MPPERLDGHATPDATRAQAEEGPMGSSFYRDHDGLMLSTLGLGTYLGETDQAAREAYQASIARALEGGITVVDTASNYRHQASERDVGRALEQVDDRERVFLVTKGGFLHGDVDATASFQEHVQSTYLDAGLIDPNDIASGAHAMTPAFLEHELEASLDNLGVETVDLYLVHNPETQLEAGVARETVHARLREAFTMLERQRAEGLIQGYGVATWDALRVRPENPSHLGLEQLVGLAQDAHEAEGPGDEHGFEGIQLPFNLAMHEAASAPTQPWEGDLVTPFEAAQRAGLVVLTSASLLQSRLIGNVPPEVRQRFDADDDLSAALAFARSPLGTTTALVGMGTPEHVDQNLDAALDHPPDPNAVEALIAAVAEASPEEA